AGCCDAGLMALNAPVSTLADQVGACARLSNHKLKPPPPDHQDSAALQRTTVMRKIVLSLMRAMIVAPLLHAVAQANSPSALFVRKTLFSNNSTGIMFQNSQASTGLLNDDPLGSAEVTVQNSVVANNGTIGVLSGRFSAVRLATSTIANNGLGIWAQRTSAVRQVFQSTVNGNGTGWLVADGGKVHSSRKNSIDANTSSNTAQLVGPTMPLAATATIQKNIKTDFGAACNGVANDAPAFMRFNSWARAQSLPITLTIPSGSVCKFASTPNAFAIGVKNLTVSGYGATFTTTQSSFFLGGYAVVQNKGTSALVAAVAAGATSVRLLTPKQSSLFKVGRYVLLTGGDLQGFGYPPNPWVFEYAIVSAI